MTTRGPGGAPAWLAVLVACALIGCSTAPPSPPPSVAGGTATADATPASRAPTGSAVPSTPSSAPASASPSPSVARSPATPSPSPSASVATAPSSPDDLHVYRTVVPMGFPFAADVDYRYAPNFYERRGGRARDYNHVKRVLRDGTRERAHDGVDIFVERGTPVLAVFDGVVIDPAVRWRPWNPARYGTTAVVVSTEPTSAGYAALYMHLDRIDVEPGDRVRRGDVIGAAGSSGNAIGSPLHLHFEMRSPFLFTVRQAGLTRRIDAFDPYPSLVAADPRAEEGQPGEAGTGDRDLLAMERDHRPT